MGWDIYEIGPVPDMEDCAQVGQDDYTDRARRECRAYIGQLKRQFGEQPEGCRFYIKANPHDFGTYHEVALKYDNRNEMAIMYAIRVEEDTPSYWDEQARKELGLNTPIGESKMS